MFVFDRKVRDIQENKNWLCTITRTKAEIPFSRTKRNEKKGDSRNHKKICGVGMALLFFCCSHIRDQHNRQTFRPNSNRIIIHRCILYYINVYENASAKNEPTTINERSSKKERERDRNWTHEGVIAKLQLDVRTKRKYLAKFNSNNNNNKSNQIQTA